MGRVLQIPPRWSSYLVFKGTKLIWEELAPKNMRSFVQPKCPRDTRSPPMKKGCSTARKRAEAAAQAVLQRGEPAHRSQAHFQGRTALFQHPSHTKAPLSSPSLLISPIFPRIPKHFIKGLFLDLKYPPSPKAWALKLALRTMFWGNWRIFNRWCLVKGQVTKSCPGGGGGDSFFLPSV